MAFKTFHNGKYYVTFKRGFEDFRKDITVTVDKVFESDSLRISLADEEDPTFLFILNVSRCDYEDLKKQQGLLIDFDNFPAQIVRLLQQCAVNNMFLIMQQSNPLQYYFEIVEHNEFKKLVHLSLKTGPASDDDIKKHMSNTIAILKNALASLKSSSSSSEVLWNDKCTNLERKVHDLSIALSKLEEDKIRKDAEYQEILRQERDKLTQEKLQWQKTVESNANAHITKSQDMVAKKEKQIEEMNSMCKKLKENIAQLENVISDKSQRLSFLEKEVQKSHIEVATLNAKNATLQRELTEKDKQCMQLNSKCIYLEKTIKEQNEKNLELSSKIQNLKKEKDNLEEKLALSESLVGKNNEAARATTEQLLKANQIIAKQNTDLIEMKEKLLCRTAIALEQEKVIEKNTKEIEDLKLEVTSTKENMEKVTEELKVLKEKYVTNEEALKDKDETIKNNNMVIQWLHKKLEDHTPHEDVPQRAYTSTGSSTPYFLHKNSNQSEEVSEESINFYGTSKLSNIEDSPGVQTQAKVGLDPKYLKPASQDSKNKEKGTNRAKSTENLYPKGKENQNINLPKVDYREKKSSRPSTYRATPVSAYFPK